MAKSTFALAIGDIVNRTVVLIRTDATFDFIQAEFFSDTPGHVVIRRKTYLQKHLARLYGPVHCKSEATAEDTPPILWPTMGSFFVPKSAALPA